MRANTRVDFISRFAILGDEEGIEGVVIDEEQLHELDAGKFVFNSPIYVFLVSINQKSV